MHTTIIGMYFCAKYNILFNYTSKPTLPLVHEGKGAVGKRCIQIVVIPAGNLDHFSLVSLQLALPTVSLSVLFSASPVSLSNAVRSTTTLECTRHKRTTPLRGFPLEFASRIEPID